MGILDRLLNKFTATELVPMSGHGGAVYLSEAWRRFGEILSRPVGSRTVFTVYVQTRDLADLAREIQKEKLLDDYEEVHLTFFHRSRLYDMLVKKEEERIALRNAPVPESRIRSDLLAD